MVEEIRVIKVSKPFVLGVCNCPCKEDIPIRRGNFYLRRYKTGHSNVKGKYKRENGRHLCNNYWMIIKPNYFSSDSRGRVLEHVFVYQEYYQCCMLPWGDVHHKDGISDTEDANRIENLEGMTHGRHMSITHTKNKKGRRCSHPECKNPLKVIIDKDGYEKWCKDGNGGFWCSICAQRVRRRRKREEDTHSG